MLQICEVILCWYELGKVVQALLLQIIRPQHLALSALYLNEMAKAIMDDVAHGLNMTL